MRRKKLIRITTVPISLQILLKGQLRFMSDYFDVVAMSSGPKAELDQVAAYEKVPVFEIEMTRKITPLKDLIAVWKLYKQLKKEQPDIVHTHTPKAGIVGMIASFLARVPNRLHTVAGLPLMEAKGLKRKVLLMVEKLTYAFATKVYPNSAVLHQFIVANKLAKLAKLHVIGNGSTNGIDTTYFSKEALTDLDVEALKEKLGILPTDKVFIFIGRLVGDKGVNELVQAFSLLHNDHANLKLILVGPLESDLDPLQPETLLQIEHNAAMLAVGFQKDVRAYLAISNFLVFPSYREGFPNVVMQAGSMGLPAIVTNINGCNEIIIENENGVIIPVKDAEALHSAMKNMIVNENKASQMAQNARPLITSRYEQKMIWNAILEEYNKMIN